MKNIGFIRGIQEADLAVCETADSFLQSAMWGRFKSRFGWNAGAFLIDWINGGEKSLLVLSRRIAPGITMAYIPWGPELPDGFTGDKAGAAAELARALRPCFRGAAFIRIDPPWFSDDISDTIPHSSFKRAPADIQPPDTVLVDLTPPEENILAAMKPKWRYNIGLAEKRGVTVNNAAVDDCCGKALDVFYRLLVKTAERDGIAIRSLEYYQSLFEMYRNEGGAELRLYKAGHEGDTLAAIVTLFRGKQAIYLYGASSNIKRNLMAPYALQWRAMRDAKMYGCTEYDLFGIPPDENPDHPMAGLYRFKTGFGGRIIHRPGSWDYPCRPVLYYLFCTAERLRKKVRDRRKKRHGFSEK